MFDIRNNLSLLFDFYIVAKEKSFSKAAKNNFISQSNLSRSVQNLEDILKLNLIIRSNKGIELTLDGEKLYKKLDGMFNNFSDFSLNDNNDEKINGTLTIGSTRNIADNKLMPFLVEFNNLYPNVKIKILTDSASNLNDYLHKHKIDVLIDYLPHINYSEKFDLEIKAFGEFKTCFACSKDFYEKEGKKIRSLKDLNKYNLVIPGKSRRRQLLDESLQKNNIDLNPQIEMPDSKLMIDFVNNSDYIGYFIEDELKDTPLVILNLKEDMPLNSIGLIHFNNVNTITKNFVKFVEEKL